MKYSITYRPATTNDVDFCVETIIRAEKGRSNIFPYSKIFDIPEEEFRTIIKEIVLEDIEGQEMAISTFTILEHHNTYAGACGSWIECINGISSNRLKANILQHFIPKANFEKAQPILKMLKPLNIDREPHTVQLESLYILKEFRSMDLYLEMVKTIAESRIAQHPELNINRSFAGFSEQNWFMGKAAARIGYKPYMIAEITDKAALKYVSGLKRYVVYKQHND